MSRYKYEACPRCTANGKDSRGDNLVVYDNGHAHCFACSWHRFPKHYNHLVKENHGPKSVCPSDFTREVPARAWQWVLQYGLPFTHWQAHCGYSEEKGERLVFRVYNGQSMAFSIGRLLTEPTREQRKWYVWGDSHKHCEIVGQGSGESIALVEDIVSAHKVGQVNECIPLFGTRVHPCHIYYLANQRRPVTIWLDKDQELNVKKQALQLQSLIDQPVKVVTTEKDPKSLSFEQIEKELNV